MIRIKLGLIEQSKEVRRYRLDPFSTDKMYCLNKLCCIVIIITNSLHKLLLYQRTT